MKRLSINKKKGASPTIKYELEAKKALEDFINNWQLATGLSKFEEAFLYVDPADPVWNEEGKLSKLYDEMDNKAFEVVKIAKKALKLMR